jgi:hypothetical protein
MKLVNTLLRLRSNHIKRSKFFCLALFFSIFVFLLFSTTGLLCRIILHYVDFPDESILRNLLQHYSQKCIYLGFAFISLPLLMILGVFIFKCFLNCVFWFSDFVDKICTNDPSLLSNDSQHQEKELRNIKTTKEEKN